jgi:hypothetical protein
VKRRVILLVGTAAALLLAFWGYRLVARVPEPGAARRPPGAIPPGALGERQLRPRPRGAFPMPEEGDRVHFERRDEQNRLRAIYEARHWRKIDPRTYEADRPDVELRLKSGQRVHVTAENGTVRVDGTGRNPPTHITLTGDVQIDVDRSTAPGKRMPLDQRRQDRLRIRMDKVELDNELKSIKTSSRVSLQSAEADIRGRGLIITWTEAPRRELEKLRIENGEEIVVRDVPEDLAVVSLPGAPTKRAAAAPLRREAPPRPPARPAARRPAAAAEPEAEGPAQEQNVYLAQFFEDVTVRSGQGAIRGAELLGLRFDWEGDLEGRSARPAGAAQPAAPKPAPGSPSAPPAATRPAAAAPAPTTRPAGPEPGTMVITWSGPLVLKPVGRTDAPSDKRYTLTGEAPVGGRVVLTDSKSTARCDSFLFRREPAAGGEEVQEGYLRASKDGSRGVELALEDGSEVTCRGTIRVDRRAGKAHLVGPGRMVGRRADAAGASAPGRATTRPTTRPAADTITWSDSVHATFREERVRDAAGRERARQVLDRALFTGRVRLERGGSDEYVNCDVLDVEMARGRDGGSYPGRAVATGHVTARQEGSDIAADEVTVEFRESAGEGQGGESGGEPVSLVAQGHVKVTDERGDETMTAEAHRLESDLIARSATLTAPPAGADPGPQLARITQGHNTLSGRKISLHEVKADDGNREVEVFVNGPGSLGFLTSKDIQGRELPRPRPVKVVWRGSMKYLGRDDFAEFLEQVEMDSGPEHMSCRQMRLWFGKTPGEDDRSSTTRPAAGRRAKGLALGVEPYSRRRVKMIVADGDVVLRTRHEDEKGHLDRMLQITGQKLEYDGDFARVSVSGAGTLVSQDYREPPDGEEAGDAEPASPLDRPSQTVLKWQRHGQLLMKQREVTVDGDVVMRHRSGNKILLVERLNVPRARKDKWAKLDDGRATDLRCRKLLVLFAGDSADPSAPATPPARTGPDLGAVSTISASGNVYVEDGPRRLIAQRLFYDRSLDVVTVWGFLKGQRTADAQLIYEDPASRRRPQVTRSPKILWFRKSDRILTEKVTGTGGR